MHPRLFGLIASLITFSALGADKALPLELECEKQWIVQSGQLALSAVTDGTLYKKWTANEARCGKTSTYWGRLAIIQVLANDLNGAKESLKRAPSSSDEYSFVVDVAKAQLAVHERLASPKPITASDLAFFEGQYTKVVKKHPRWPTPYALLGGVQTLQGKHAEAVKNLLVALDGDAYQLSGVYRNLTISLSALGRYESAMKAADKAFELNKSLVSDPAFAYAMAQTNIGLRQLDEARTVIQVIAAKRPEVKDDPQFQEIVRVYRAEAKKSKNAIAP